MRTNFVTFAFAACVAAAPAYASTAADILAANKAASGGKSWDGKATLKAQYDYAGQGMTGKVTSLDDLARGTWVDDATIGPATQVNGFDGAHAWTKDASGAVTNQDGGEQRQLAVNEGYRRTNMWWRGDFGGASVVDDGEKKDGGAAFEVLTVTPKDGKNFDAWFDEKTHLLSRVVEKQGPQTSTTVYSDYRALDGVEISYKQAISIGDAKYDQTVSMTAASFLPAQDVSAFAAPKVTLSDTTIAGGDETTFPFHLYNNHIYADVSVNGKGPYQFIFDTGGVNLLTPPLVSELGLKSEGQMQGNGAGDGHMDVGLTKVSSLKLGNATVKDQVFTVMALNSMSKVEGVGMPGMVGFETFRRFVTRVDYGASTITLIKQAAFDPKDAGTAIPFAFNGNNIDAPAAYDGVKGTFTIDTGSRASLTLNGPFVAANKLGAKGKSVDAVTGWGVGGPTRSVALRGGTLMLDAMRIDAPVVELSTDKGGAFAETATSGNIGSGVLKRFVVTLDYEHTTMYLKPVAAPMTDLDTFDRAGMWFNEGGDGYTVVDVTKGTPADQAGLKAGDEITAVDGKPANSIPLHEARRELRNRAPGTVVTFAVKGKGDVKVTLRDLI
ncbi:MAG TPA: aspartyl protease family protein [Rhizomicrobium sp.]|nr:aspartyl protease family protein [Rhizomicrobium sp.]